MNEFSTAFFATLNIGSFICFGLDKRKAQKNKHRIPERLLLIMTLLGGTIGSVLGMLLFNHKISKRSFVLKILGIILLQILVIYLIYNYTK
ncbi:MULTISPECIES: DUF1294 domain-containing protein [unclassified Kaistella]|uniref:DUF1294 domain-containing protein n=1 Tax=unclassified Kaistella TaxID=2762626 RepID=UPI002736254E|nr:MULTISPECIES: DUF1294 domain-containing protein [unclassified Kaistella]MDP2454361.1 DUF1294 domain-containing protein [Kaistella sp. SH11-4b]MDP2457848.1 DUF1294 domain-containing protein [Kaistella sp. SH40-3]MDP2460754.1 DUF1294 domain-containing protein [Kaistella sp. SH19-2b]